MLGHDALMQQQRVAGDRVLRARPLDTRRAETLPSPSARSAVTPETKRSLRRAFAISFRPLAR